MTFSGYKADERSAVYKPQRRPSFLEKAGKRAVKVAVAATKATRKFSFYGNNGEGAELVAIGVSPKRDNILHDIQFVYLEVCIHPLGNINLFVTKYL